MQSKPLVKVNSTYPLMIESELDIEGMRLRFDGHVHHVTPKVYPNPTIRIHGWVTANLLSLPEDSIQIEAPIHVDTDADHIFVGLAKDPLFFERIIVQDMRDFKDNDCAIYLPPFGRRGPIGDRSKVVYNWIKAFLEGSDI